MGVEQFPPVGDGNGQRDATTEGKGSEAATTPLPASAPDSSEATAERTATMPDNPVGQGAEATAPTERMPASEHGQATPDQPTPLEQVAAGGTEGVPGTAPTVPGEPPLGGTPVAGPQTPAAPGQPLAAGTVGQTWVAPPQPKAAPSARAAQIKTAVIAVIATAVIVGGGFAFASSLGDDSSSSSSGSSDTNGPGGGMPDGGMGGYGDMGGGFSGGNGMADGLGGSGVMALTDALHGDFTVTDDTGAYVVQRFQQGEVTEVSETSISVASEDGYTQSYVVDDASLVSGVEVGATVILTATVTDSVATVATVSTVSEQIQPNPDMSAGQGGGREGTTDDEETTQEG